MTTNWKKKLGNIALILASSAFGLLLCELGARLVLNPADYLSVEMVEDQILGRVPSATTRSNGYDRWGFRNRRVPEAVDLVAIGDSHTYGNCATMEESWPYALGRLRSSSVYNLALGGYGPNQYYHLFKTRALELKPRVIVCGLYMGDDFENAFLITYGLPHWAYLRQMPAEKVNFDIWEVPPSLSWHKEIRNWMARHSVVYKLVVHGPLLGRIKGQFQIKHASQMEDSATALIVSEKNISEAFRPKGILRRLDQDSESVREGMRITFKLLAEMNEICQPHNIRFLVAVIPTKEMVFSDFLEHNRQLPLSDTLDKLLANERLARAKTLSFFDEQKIAYVDTLPALKRSVEKEIYTRSAGDMHPNKNGYRVIAEAIAEAMSKTDGKR